MSMDYSFEELKKYIQGQIDLGMPEVLFDEPWSLAHTNRKPSLKVMESVVIKDKQENNILQQRNSFSQGDSFVKQMTPTMDMPSARPVKKRVSVFESAENLNDFYDIILNESIYAQSKAIARYEGPKNPKLLLLLQSPKEPLSDSFIESSTGEMLTRLFASLHIEKSNIGVTYFYKSTLARNILPLLETALRKMLLKELSFIKPEIMVTFGEPLFHQIFGKGKSFNDFAGTDMDFNGYKTCSLVDAYAMTTDKQLKWVTWKMHIPRGTFFKI